MGIPDEAMSGVPSLGAPQVFALPFALVIVASIWFAWTLWKPAKEKLPCQRGQRLPIREPAHETGCKRASLSNVSAAHTSTVTVDASETAPTTTATEDHGLDHVASGDADRSVPDQSPGAEAAFLEDTLADNGASLVESSMAASKAPATPDLCLNLVAPVVADCNLPDQPSVAVVEDEPAAACSSPDLVESCADSAGSTHDIDVEPVPVESADRSLPSLPPETSAMATEKEQVAGCSLELADNALKSETAAASPGFEPEHAPSHFRREEQAALPCGPSEEVPSLLRPGPLVSELPKSTEQVPPPANLAEQDVSPVRSVGQTVSHAGFHATRLASGALGEEHRADVADHAREADVFRKASAAAARAAAARASAAAVASSVVRAGVAAASSVRHDLSSSTVTAAGNAQRSVTGVRCRTAAAAAVRAAAACAHAKAGGGHKLNSALRSGSESNTSPRVVAVSW